MTTVDILTALEEEFPVNRMVNIEGWPGPIWVWRFGIEELEGISKLSGSDMDKALWIVQKGIGDKENRGTFDNDRGEAWLQSHPAELTALGELVTDFNELEGPSEGRKKKSDGSPASSSFVEISDADTHDD